MVISRALHNEAYKDPKEGSSNAYKKKNVIIYFNILFTIITEYFTLKATILAIFSRHSAFSIGNF